MELEKLTKNKTMKMQQAYVAERFKCEKCGNTKNLGYDHIIPMSILADFNIDATRSFWEENGSVLCFACNIKKSHRLDFCNPKTKELLTKLLLTLDK